MPKEISGLRIARSFITPTETRVSRELDFQLGARQGIAIHQVLGSMYVDGSQGPPSTALQAFFDCNQTLHLETGSLETVPNAAGEDEDTIDSEVFYRQDLNVGANDDVSTEFRASVSISVTPSGPVIFPTPIFTARNITHSGQTNAAAFDADCHVIIYYTFVEFSLAELGLILSRRQ